MTPAWASPAKVYHGGERMASIDISILINYKHNMVQKTIFSGLILILIMVACGQSPVITTSTSYPSTTMEQSTTTSSTTFAESTPSPLPGIRIDIADQALFNGDYSLAQTEYQSALLSSVEPSIQAAAVWGLGRVNLQAGNYGAALSSFNKLIINYPDSPHGIHAHLLRGEIMLRLERYTEAVEAYSSYLSLRPGVIDSYVLEHRADAYFLLGKYDLAVVDYHTALASPHISDDTNRQIKLAQAFEELGESTSALGILNTLFDGTSSSKLKAQMDLYRGRLYLSLGQPGEAYAFFLDAVENYPYEYESYSALVALVEAGVQVNDFQRGLVDYYAGQYGVAYDAFSRYTTSFPDNDGTPYYYRALALRDSGLSLEALDAFNFFTTNFASNELWSIACEEKADLQWFLLGEYQAAAQTLVECARQTSEISSIPRILLTAGRIYERGGFLEEAILLWESIADSYPGSEFVPEALFQAGILNYRVGNFLKAQVDFQRTYLFSLNLEDQARSLFWTGKTQIALDDLAGAQDSFLRTAAIDQTNFYCLRAQDMLFNRPLFGIQSFTLPDMDINSERVRAEAWLRITFNLPAATDLTNLGPLASDNRFLRGQEFWNLDMTDLALQEFEDLRVSVSENAADSFRLGNYLLDLNFYRPAIFALRQVLTLAGMDEQVDTLAAPKYFNLIRYGFYYQDLVLSRSATSDFDPLLIFSIIRQESLYDKDAGSGQGALGLMQITPGTAQLIVDGLGWPMDFQTNYLFRPMVNLTLGTSHLSDLQLMNSYEIFPALAAYNAGQNAAAVWRNLSGSDSDLFLETIRYPETHDYIRSIYEIYFMYNYVYGFSP